MPSFTEYVHLIADGKEAIAVIHKINEAIAKLRREAASPINVKVKPEHEKEQDGERKLRGEKKQTYDAELAALRKKKEEIAAIKAMNKEQGNPAFNVKYGSPESIAQAQRFNEQLAESTRRINRLADAHKHISAAAKAADVEVSNSLREKLASQVTNRTEKSEAQAIRDAAYAEKERVGALLEREKQERAGLIRINELERERSRIIKEREGQEKEGTLRLNELERERSNLIKSREGQEKEGTARLHEIEKERSNIVKQREGEEKEGLSRINAMETERTQLIRQREREEVEGYRRIHQMQQQKLRDEEKLARIARQRQQEQDRAEHRARRERETQIASYRESGIRGVAGEIHRDIRRNMVYGAIGGGEHLMHKGYEADVAQDTAVETLRQAGRTADQINTMIANAQRLSFANPSVSATEMMLMQQHNVGAFGDFGTAMANNNLSARYLAIRKGKVGEDQALTENLAILKIGEETGRIRDGGFMRKLYDQELKIAQAEGAQYKPEQLLTTVRTLKSTKFGLSDETLLNVLPFAGIGEGASRVGNQISMLQKSMSFVGKSLSKTNMATIAGTVLSDGKAGYNAEVFRDVASGNLVKLSELMDKFFTQKGFNVNDRSAANINDMMTVLSRAVGNASAKEAMALLSENRDQIQKEQKNAALAQGLNTPPTSTRTLEGAQQAMVAQFENASAAAMKPYNKTIIGMMNGLTVLEEQLTKKMNNIGTTALAGGTGVAVGAVTALGVAALKNPAETAEIALLTDIAANTSAIAVNTGVSAAGGLMSKLGIAAGVVAAGYDAILAGGDIKAWWRLHKLKEAAKTPEGVADYNKAREEDDKEALRLAQAQVAAHDEQMKNQPHPKGQIDQVAEQYAQSLAEALARVEYDRAHQVKYNVRVGESIKNTGGLDGVRQDDERILSNARRGRGFGLMGPNNPIFHNETPPEPVYHPNPQLDYDVEEAPHHGGHHRGRHHGRHHRRYPHHEQASESEGTAPAPPVSTPAPTGEPSSISDSTAKDALSKIASAGSEAAGALSGAGNEIKSSGTTAAGSIQAGGQSIAGALDKAAAAINGAAARFGATGGVPPVAPQPTGKSIRGDK